VMAAWSLGREGAILAIFGLGLGSSSQQPLQVLNVASAKGKCNEILDRSGSVLPCEVGGLPTNKTDCLARGCCYDEQRPNTRCYVPVLEDRNGLPVDLLSGKSMPLGLDQATLLGAVRVSRGMTLALNISTSPVQSMMNSSILVFTDVDATITNSFYELQLRGDSLYFCTPERRCCDTGVLIQPGNKTIVEVLVDSTPRSTADAWWFENDVFLRFPSYEECRTALPSSSHHLVWIPGNLNGTLDNATFSRNPFESNNRTFQVFYDERGVYSWENAPGYNWNLARQRCRRLDMELGSIQSTIENDAVVARIREEAWIGLRGLGLTTVFSWSDFSDSRYVHDRIDDQLYVAIRSNHYYGNPGEWTVNDVDDRKSEYVCIELLPPNTSYTENLAFNRSTILYSESNTSVSQLVVDGDATSCILGSLANASLSVFLDGMYFIGDIIITMGLHRTFNPVVTTGVGLTHQCDLIPGDFADGDNFLFNCRGHIGNEVHIDIAQGIGSGAGNITVSKICEVRVYESKSTLMPTLSPTASPVTDPPT